MDQYDKLRSEREIPCPESFEDFERDMKSGINNFNPEGVKDGLADNRRLNDRYIRNAGCAHNVRSK